MSKAKPTIVTNNHFAKKLINWYTINKRNLPWRQTTDPFKIWLSEIILQQTRVRQGLPYYIKFIENFNNISGLAQASEEEVLRLWQGLGYYSRARNLHRCAKEIDENLNKKFPDNYNHLLELPGIGKYTAAAIASFAFRERVPVIDGNVYRVLSRIFGVHEDISTGAGQRRFQELAATLIPKTNSDIYNQAIMEFGALQCTPKAPNCAECIFNIECYARRHKLQYELPVKGKKVKIKDRHFNYFVIVAENGNMVLTKRNEDDIWKGLYDYPLIESRLFQDFDSLIPQSPLLTDLAPHIVGIDTTNDYKHILTHRRIFAKFYTIHVRQSYHLQLLLNNYHLKFFSTHEIEELPKPVLVSRYLNDTIFSLDL